MRKKIQQISLLLIGISLPLAIYSKGLLFIAIGLGSILGIACLNFKEIKQSLIKIKNSKVTLLLLSILAIFVISVIFSINQSYSIHKLVGVLITLFFSILTFVVLDNTKKEDFSIVFKSMTFMFCLDLIYMYYAMFILSDAETGSGWVRVPAMQLAVIFPLVFGWLYNNKNYKELAWGLLFFSIVTIFATGGRSAMIAFMIAVGMIIFALAWLKKEKLNLKRIFILLTLFTLSIFSGLQTYKVFDTKLEGNAFNHRLTLKSKDLSSGRIKIWQASIKEGLKNPIIGTGIGSFKTALKDKIPSRKDLIYHPHNFLIELFVSTGILGGLAVLGLICYIWRSLFFKISSENIVAIFPLASYNAYWIIGLINISILQLQWMVFVSVSTLIGHFYIQFNNNKD
ncbi:MAG: O-antigen ligase family protein [Proteobacteria bacterium]|nr:O-antigen ligase family protein [Pseudomonadota bacterium]